MNTYRYLIERQYLWAICQGIRLIGSKGERGRLAYTETVDENLFEPLLEEARNEFVQGDGSELDGKIRAVHSSAAFVCNVFHYWRHDQRPTSAIAWACGIPSTRVDSPLFEVKRPIMENVNRQQFPRDPNLDVIFPHIASGHIKESAIESKFTEPYSGRKKKGLRETYLREHSLWADINACHALGRELCPSNSRFKHLDAAQLLKNVLGLKHRNGKDGFCLIYLWCDGPGEEACRHRQEVAEFASIMRQDGMEFRSRTYQDVLLKLARKQLGDHKKYVEYLVRRYL